jgi:3-isopropylmalate/(R)-2-methylmalate dehydratase small subunit
VTSSWQGATLALAHRVSKLALKHLGVAAVIAPSYGGLFFRNAFNLGLLLITSPDTDLLQDQELLAHVSIGLDVTFSPEKQIKTAPIPDFLLDMVRAGGLINQLKQTLHNKEAR